MKKHGINQKALVKYAILNEPYLLPMYIKSPYNPIITKSICKKMLNRSCGIEIECFGSLAIKHTKLFRRVLDYERVAEYYNIMNFKEDNSYNYSLTKFNEHKIRISNYKQLTGLFEILSDMKKYCQLNMGSGIHIHVDISDFWSKAGLNSGSINDTNRKLVNNYWQRYLGSKMNEIEQIFYPGSSYTGTYNTFKTIELGYKNRHWVSLRDTYTTLEFRIAPMTFEYTDIVRWCCELSQMIDKILYKHPFPIPTTIELPQVEEVEEETEEEEYDAPCNCPVCTARRARENEQPRIRVRGRIQL